MGTKVTCKVNGKPESPYEGRFWCGVGPAYPEEPQAVQRKDIYAASDLVRPEKAT